MRAANVRHSQELRDCAVWCDQQASAQLAAPAMLHQLGMDAASFKAVRVRMGSRTNALYDAAYSKEEKYAEMLITEAGRSKNMHVTRLKEAQRVQLASIARALDVPFRQLEELHSDQVDQIGIAVSRAEKAARHAVTLLNGASVKEKEIEQKRLPAPDFIR